MLQYNSEYFNETAEEDFEKSPLAYNPEIWEEQENLETDLVLAKTEIARLKKQRKAWKKEKKQMQKELNEERKIAEKTKETLLLERQQHSFDLQLQEQRHHYETEIFRKDVLAKANLMTMFNIMQYQRPREQLTEACTQALSDAVNAISREAIDDAVDVDV